MRCRKDLHMIPFSTDEFRDMGYRDNHAVLKGANEIIFARILYGLPPIWIEFRADVH
jgi:hypothetical protein